MSKTSFSDKPHFFTFHWELYPIHLFAIHLEPDITPQAVWCVAKSGSSFLKRLCQNIPSPVSSTAVTPANGHIVRPPDLVEHIAHKIIITWKLSLGVCKR